MAFRKAEFYCLECGSKYGLFGGQLVSDTPDLRVRYERLQAEWEEHAEGALLIDGGWRTECDQCKPGGEYHRAHASPGELARHDAAVAWLQQRASQKISS
jgi:hypothetical protein